MELGRAVAGRGRGAAQSAAQQMKPPHACFLLRCHVAAAACRAHRWRGSRWGLGSAWCTRCSTGRTAGRRARQEARVGTRARRCNGRLAPGVPPAPKVLLSSATLPVPWSVRPCFNAAWQGPSHLAVGDRGAGLAGAPQLGHALEPRGVAHKLAVAVGAGGVACGERSGGGRAYGLGCANTAGRAGAARAGNAGSGCERRGTRGICQGFRVDSPGMQGCPWDRGLV